MNRKQEKAMFAKRPKALKLIITNQNWQTVKNVDNAEFPNTVNWKTATKILFSKYTDIAEYVEKHKNLKNRVMLVKHPKQVLGNKVVYDGVNVYVENRGFV